MGGTRVVLELPVERTKHLKLWPAWVARLLVYDDDASDDQALWSGFARRIFQLARAHEEIYAHPLSCLLVDAKTQAYFEKRGFAWKVVHLGEYHWLLECKQPDELVYLMKQGSFEQVVIFFASGIELAQKIVRNASVQAPLTDNRYDTPFLHYCDDVGGFIFFSHTHDNLEILGSPRFVVERCLIGIAKEEGLVSSRSPR